MSTINLTRYIRSINNLLSAKHVVILKKVKNDEEIILNYYLLCKCGTKVCRTAIAVNPQYNTGVAAQVVRDVIRAIRKHEREWDWINQRHRKCLFFNPDPSVRRR